MATCQEEDQIPPRRQKHSTACDRCRRRKVACDASEMPDNRCSHCVARGVECQYNPATKMRRPTRSYVEALEDRVQKMEELINKMQTNPQLPQDPHTASVGMRRRGSSQNSTYPSHVINHAKGADLCRHGLNLLQEPECVIPEESDDESESSLNGSIGYHGKSSNKQLVLHVIDLKTKRTGKQGSRPATKAPSMGHQFELPITVGYQLPPHTDFPPPDLLHKLVESYFTNFNLYLPLLHRPTLEQDIKSRQHLRDRDFGNIVLLVCAIGSIWTEDPRISNRGPALGRGWDWFEQVGYEPWSLLARPRLQDVQICALMAGYLNSSNSHQGSWTLVSLGIRMAQDVGAHRKKMYDPKPTVEQELWKRAFWVLLALDRMSSFAMGRPNAIHDEDFDVDYMTECDDEYWINTDRELAFKQPPGKPSKVAYTNHFLRLLKILDFASRTIYTINKSKVLFGFVGAEWKKGIVAELDSALNKWVNSVPTHLRWDPNRQDLIFFTQSACLYVQYYQIQIAVHRQFLPTPRRNLTPLPLPALTICTSAARSCVSVLEAQYKRTHLSTCALTPMQLPLTMSCVVLLVHLWGGNPSERETQSLCADIQKCVTMLKEMERENPAARKIRAILTALISIKMSAPEGPKGSAPHRARPADLGELITVAMENLRISLMDESMEIRTTDDEGLLCTVHWDSATKNIASPSPFCMITETREPWKAPVNSSPYTPSAEANASYRPSPTWQRARESNASQVQPQDQPFETYSDAQDASALSPSGVNAMPSGGSMPGYDDIFSSFSGMFSDVESQALSDLLFSMGNSPTGPTSGNGRDSTTTAPAMNVDLNQWLSEGVELTDNPPWARSPGPVPDNVAEVDWDAYLRGMNGVGGVHPPGL